MGAGCRYGMTLRNAHPVFKRSAYGADLERIKPDRINVSNVVGNKRLPVNVGSVALRNNRLRRVNAWDAGQPSLKPLRLYVSNEVTDVGLVGIELNPALRSYVARHKRVNVMLNNVIANNVHVAALRFDCAAAIQSRESRLKCANAWHVQPSAPIADRGLIAETLPNRSVGRGIKMEMI
jgi:hypothetical protein